MDTLKERDFKAIFAALKDLMTARRDWLIELDGVIGDGDLGLTMSKGFSKVAETMAGFDEQDIGKILGKAGMVLAQAVPSTMGTLLATGFMKGARPAVGKTEIGLADLAAVMSDFVEGIMARGKAKPGDKTIIDALLPAAQALNVAAEAKRSLKDGLKEAYQAAIQGVEETRKMVSQHGKAAVFQEKTLGEQDPGATVGMLLVQAFADYVK